MIRLDKLNYLPHSPLERLLNSSLRIFELKKTVCVFHKNNKIYITLVYLIIFFYIYKYKVTLTIENRCFFFGSINSKLSV